MTIRFICGCGKHLKARDEMASRRSVCPRCGSPIGIPSLEPIHPGGLAPLSPQDRLRLARNQLPRPGEPDALDLGPPAALVQTRLVRLLSDRSVRSIPSGGEHLETLWHECLLYPLLAYRLCCGLSLILTLATALTALFLIPGFLATLPGVSGVSLFFTLAFGVLLLAVVGLPCSFLDRVLVSAVGGERRYIRWSGNLILTVLLSATRWLTCFLAGPVVFAAAGVLYWIHAGDLTTFDYLIAAELGTVSLAYWLYVLLAVTEGGRLRDMNPIAVIDLSHRMGWRSLIVVLLGGIVLLAHLLALVFSVENIHKVLFRGWILLALTWVSAIFWGTFFCRLLGIRCYRSRLATEVSAVVEEDEEAST